MLLRFLFLLVKDKVQSGGDFWKCFSFLKCLNVKSSNTFLKGINLDLNEWMRQILGLSAEPVDAAFEKI